MPGELPLVLLALLAERPQGGYELLGELERRYAPHYRPSPGSVYPALSALRAERLVEPVGTTRKAGFRPTARGRRMLADEESTLRRIATRTATPIVDGSLDPVLARFATRVAKFSGRVDRSAVEAVLENAANAIATLASENRDEVRT